MKRFGKIIVAGTLRVGALGLSLVVSIFLARQLSPEVFGVYTLILSVVAVATFPAQFGLPNLVIREVSRAHSQNNLPKVKSVLVWALRFIIRNSLLVALVVVLVSWLSYPTIPEADMFLVAIVILLIPLMSVSALRTSALNGLSKSIFSIIPDGVARPAIFLCLLFTSGSFIDLNLQVALTCYIGALVLALGFGARTLWRTISKVQAEPLGRNEMKLLLASVTPMALIAGLQLMSRHTDVIMLGFLHSSKEVGIYRVAYSVSAIALIGQQVVNIFMRPRIAGITGADQRSELQHVSTLSVLASCALTLPFFLAAIIFPDFIISSLYGDFYSNAASPMAILIAVQFVNSMFGSVGILLMMTGNERKNVFGLILSTFVNIILNAILIPYFGAVGAALATGASIVVWNVLFWFQVKQILDVDASIMSILSKR